MTAQLPPQKQMTGMLGHPVAENPIDRMFDAVYAHYGLHWQFWKCDVAADDLGAAIAGIFGTAFGGNVIGRRVSHSLTILGVLFALALVTEDMRALSGHHQFGAVVADAPAVQLVDFHAFNVGRRHTQHSQWQAMGN